MCTRGRDGAQQVGGEAGAQQVRSQSWCRQLGGQAGEEERSEASGRRTGGE